jgi:hypothetical protein
MITVLDLEPTTKALCLAVAAVVWTLLFFKLYREQQRRNAVKRAYWWHRYIRAYKASLAAYKASLASRAPERLSKGVEARRPVEPARQRDTLEAAAAAGAFSGPVKGQEKEAR